MRENCTYGSMRGRAFPTGRPALLYTLLGPCAGPVCGEALGQYANMVIDVSTIDEASAAIGGRVYHKGDKFPIRQPPYERLVIGVTDLN